MNRYTHWLKISGITTEKDEKKQYLEIEAYLKAHEGATAEMYFYEFGSLCDRVVKLVCSESYDDLDMMVDSGSHSLRCLAGAPRGLLGTGLPFEVPQRLIAE